MLSFKMQPGARIAIPERGSSLPPLHFHSTGPRHDVSFPSCVSAVVMEPRTARVFPWTRLPLHIQQRILSYAVLPGGPGTPLIVGDSDHSAHLRNVAVPILVALGSWSAYFNGARELYRDVLVDLGVHRRSSMNFLTSSRALRPRGMVVRLRMIVDIKKSLPLFDTGHTIRQSKGKLIKMNIPTALRCMKLHGRLSEVEFLVDGLGDTAEVEQGVPENYLPLAEIQLVGRSVLQVRDGQVASLSPGIRLDIKQGETVIAPAFLACRAWQSGFLPLFEDGTFQKGVSLGLILNSHQSDQRRSTGEDNGDSISRVDGASLMRYWLGGTIMELLDVTVQPSSWIDPFTLSTQRAETFDGPASSVTSHQSEPLPRESAVVDSIENENDISASPAKATDSSLQSVWKSGVADSEEPLSFLNQQRRPDDAHMGCSISHDSPGPSKGCNTPSEGGSLSDEVEMHTLHQRFGVGSKARENMSSPSRSRSSSSVRSVLIATVSSGMASPTSSSELEACWTNSQRSMSLGEYHHINLIAAFLTENSSESDQREEKAHEPSVLDVRTPREELSPGKQKHDAYTNIVIQDVPVGDNGCSSTSAANTAMQADREYDPTESSRQSFREPADATLQKVDETAPHTHRDATRLSISLETVGDQLGDQLSRPFVLHGAEPAVDAGKCATFTSVEEHAELSASSKKAAKKTRKTESKRRKRQAKLRAQGDSVNTG